MKEGQARQEGSSRASRRLAVGVSTDGIDLNTSLSGAVNGR
jgi:hypothetical protein